jgi:hypothetical protein
MSGLWESQSCAEWSLALSRYPSVIERQGSALLLKRDPWYRQELPDLIAARPEPYVTRGELVWVVEWKMARGVWRARNLHLARSNEPEQVESATKAAFALVDEPRKALKAFDPLKGVGPATASAVLAAYRPDLYPFFDDVVSDQIPSLPVGEFTVKNYLAYVEALRSRADELARSCQDRSWTAHQTGMSLWSAAGGKVPESG